MNIFTEVARELEGAKAITWDTCHKIYVLMDDEQVAKMREYEYDPIVTSDTHTPEQMLNLLQEWYDDSCELRFINAVSTVEGDPNEGFKSLIPQFAEQEED